MDIDETLISDYLMNNLTVSEKKDFEDRLKKNTSLNKEITSTKLIIENINTIMEKEKILKDIETVQQELKEEGFYDAAKKAYFKRRRRRKLFYRLAAAASVLIVIGVFSYIRTENNRMQYAYKDSYLPETVYIRPILDELYTFGLGSRVTAKQTQLAPALKKYYDKEFADAKETLQAYTKAYPNDALAQFYLSLCFLEENEFQQAINILSPLSTNHSLDFAPQIKWYLSLAYLGAKEKRAAKEVLQVLQSDQDFGEKANALLKKL